MIALGCARLRVFHCVNLDLGVTGGVQERVRRRLHTVRLGCNAVHTTGGGTESTAKLI